jgi:hypothetical protein
VSVRCVAARLGDLALDRDVDVRLSRCRGPVGRRSAPPILATSSALAIAGPLLGLWLFLLFEIVRSFADSHSQLLGL